MKYSKGFTLVEILVVVVIIGVLSGIVMLNVIGRIGEARIKAAKVDLRTIESAMSIYKMDNFNYPTTELGIRASRVGRRGTRGERGRRPGNAAFG